MFVKIYFIIHVTILIIRAIKLQLNVINFNIRNKLQLFVTQIRREMIR